MARDPFLNQSQDQGGTAMPVLKAGQWMFDRRYELIRQLGAGGMGVVWLARDHTEEADVALKFLPTVLVIQEGEMKRLKDEVRAGKELRHPRLVATYGLEVEDATAAIVMEYVPGQTLKELLEAQQRGFFEPEEIAGWIWDVCDALTYLHGEARRIHRDIKPANILVNAAGRARLMDFGISHRIQECVTRQSKTSEGKSGASSSTLAYASPQQIGGRQANAADDMYSLGAALYELLTGTPPFYRGAADLVAVQIKLEPVTPLMERRAELVAEGANANVGQSVPVAVETTIQACLAKEREARPADARQVYEGFSTPDAVESSPLNRSEAEIASTAERVLPEGRAKRGNPLSCAGPAGAPAKTTPGIQSPPDRPGTSPAAPPRVPLRGLSGPLWAAAALILLSLGAWAIFSQPKETIREVPKHVEDTTARQEAAQPRQRADELEKKAKDEEQKRLAAEAAAGRAAAPPAAANVPKTTNTSPAAHGGPSALPAKPSTATKDTPFINSLGMKFVPVPIGAGPSKGQRILFSIWETRSRDYAAFVKDSGHDAGEDWKTYSFREVPVGRGENEKAEDSSHPVANVSYDDAVAFCAWLTKKDRVSGQIGPQDEYRLPSDVEWSYSVGIGDKEDASASPTDKNENFDGLYPWGNAFPPPAGSGNYADETAKTKLGSDWHIIEGYTDGYALTAPVGSFKANALGLHDLGGNLWEWCADWYDHDPKYRALRGGSCFLADPANLLSWIRIINMPGGHDYGFRCVLVVSSGATSTQGGTSSTAGTSSASPNPLDSGTVGKQHEVTLPGGVKLALCFCPAGSFTMGSPSSEEGRASNEDQVKVTLTQPFWLARTEFTQAQWVAVMGSNPSYFKGDNLPVENVSADDADACIVKLNEQAPLKGWNWVLPTEAQWEYACRAGSTMPFHFDFGDVLNGTKANCDGNFPYGTSTKGPYLEKTAPVGSYAPNAWGLCDMHGNVNEWCRDAWTGSNKLLGGIDPIGARNSGRVVRGGSWGSQAQGCRASYRYWFYTDNKTDYLGFRPALAQAGAKKGFSLPVPLREIDDKKGGFRLPQFR